MPIRDRDLAVVYRPLAGLIPYAIRASTRADVHLAEISVSVHELVWTKSEFAARRIVRSAPIWGAR